MIISITDTQRLRKIEVESGSIYIIETLNDDGKWRLADSSIDNAVVVKRMVEWGMASSQESAIQLLNHGADEHNALIS